MEESKCTFVSSLYWIHNLNWCKFNLCIINLSWRTLIKLMWYYVVLHESQLKLKRCRLELFGKRWWEYHTRSLDLISVHAVIVFELFVKNTWLFSCTVSIPDTSVWSIRAIKTQAKNHPTSLNYNYTIILTLKFVLDC